MLTSSTSYVGYTTVAASWRHWCRVVLASAGIAKGKRLTCVPVIRDDVLAAGAEYVDRPVVPRR